MHGVVRWRIVDLCQWIFEEFRVVVVAKQTVSRELRAMGYRKLSARPRHHEQAEGAIEILKSFPARLDEIGGEVEPAAIEVWFADEARIGQKNKITRRWAKRGTSKRADGPTNRLGLYLRRDLPQARKGCSPHHAQMQHEAMNLHLAEIAVQIAPGAHGASRRSGRLASVEDPARHATQHPP